MFKLIRRSWEFATLVVGAYAVYKQLKLFKEMKDEVYESLTEEERASLEKLKQSLPVTLPTIEIPDIETIKAKI